MSGPQQALLMLSAAGGGTITWTWSPTDKTSGMTLSESDRRWDASPSANQYIRATSAAHKSSGKWYWEQVCLDTSGNGFAGMRNTSGAITGLTHYLFWRGNATLFNATGSQNTTYAPTFTNNDVLMIAVDLDARKMWFGKNGTFLGDPVGGNNPAFSGFNADTYAVAGWGANGGAGGVMRLVLTTNYAPPTGFSLMN